MKQKKAAWLKSALVLFCCLALLIGSTFAWFTDTVTSGLNTIATGTLNVELYHSNSAVSDERVDENTKLFLDLQGNSILWEPGVVSYENLRIVNEGDLALVYQLALNTANENYITDGGNLYGLSQVLKVAVVEGGITATDRDGVIGSVSDADWKNLASFQREGSLIADAEKTWGIVIYWQPGSNDNFWNANNGKQLSSGDALNIDLGIHLTATQMVYENDSFGNDYDVSAKDDIFPSFTGGTAGTPVEVDANGLTTAEVEIAIGDITAIVPAGVKVKDGVSALSLSVSELASSDANITLHDDEAIRSLDVHVEGVAADNTAPITITLSEAAPVGLNMGNYKLYHVENGATNEMTLVASNVDFSAHNQFKYDPVTGDIVLNMASFSEVAMVAEPAGWKGEADHSWYDASATQLYIANADQLWSFSQIVGGMAVGIAQDDFNGKTVTLVNDINLNDLTDENDYVFYPIGYYNDLKSYDKVSGGSLTSSVSSFEGIFDGAGHIVSNFYQNTWEMFGDYNSGYSGTPNHYKDAMGLFGYAYGATIKNLTVKNFSSDGEFTPTGVISAYACNSTFENIAVVNCNPRVYNTGNGGIVGIGGNDDDPDSYKLTFTNVTVDNSNKITALWGSWDVACGGLVGMFRGAGHAYMTNCHVGAQIDVYNDVCGNYQYYWYRYAGSLIGTNKNMVTDANGYTVPETSKYHATNCTVHFGDWNDYYYCELVANSLASYTHDHQMSRLTVISSLSEIKSGDTWTQTGNFLLFNGAQQKQDGEGTCYHIVKDADGNLVEHKHVDSGYDAGIDENGDGKDDLKEDKQRLYLPFNQIFTGYGWGVKHVPIYDDESLNPFQGVTVLDRTTANSVPKWTGKPLSVLTSGTTYKIGNLFSAISSEVAINNQSVIVSVSAAEGANVVASIEGNAQNWANGTLTVTGSGYIQITIQDYLYCQPTTIEVLVEDPNIIVNGGFEDGSNGWNVTTWTGTKIDTASAKSGKYGVHAKATSWAGMFNQVIAVEDGATYVLSYWYKAISGGANMKVYDTNNQDASYTSAWNNKTVWTYVTKEFQVTGTNTITLNFNGSAEVSNDEVYFDDISLIKKPLVVNGDFEEGNTGWQFNSGSHDFVTDAHSGNYAMQIGNVSAYGEAAVQTNNVTPYTDYMITFWSKRVSGTSPFTLIVSRPDSPWTAFDKVSGSSTIGDTSGEWVKYTYIVNSREFNKMLIKFSSSSANSGSIIIDDVQVIKLANDGFIIDYDMESGTGMNWKGASGSVGSFGVTTEAAHSGQYSMKAVGDGSWNGMIWRFFNTVAGNSYTITAWVKVSAGTVSIGVNDFSNEWSPVTIGTKQNVSGDTWQQVTFEFTATSSRSGISIGGSGGGSADPNSVDIVYIDDLRVTQN